KIWTTQGLTSNKGRPRAPALASVRPGRGGGRRRPSLGCVGLAAVAAFLGERGLHVLLHLFGREVLLVRGDRPLVPQRVGQLAVAVAPVHVGRRHGDGGAGRLCLGHRRVHVFDIQVQVDGRALQRL